VVKSHDLIISIILEYQGIIKYCGDVETVSPLYTDSDILDLVSAYEKDAGGARGQSGVMGGLILGVYY